jgi:hypothetical protein
MITLENVISVSDIFDFRKGYYSSLNEKQEFWLEQQLKSANYYVIKSDSTQVGYCCINGNKELLQFYITEEYMKIAQDIFTFLIKEEIIKFAYCSTFDHLLLSLSSDYQRKVSRHSYSFRSYIEASSELRGFPNLNFRRASENDLENITKYCEDFFENPILLIHRKELFVLYSGNLFLGAGEVESINEFSKPYVDIGMIVSEKYRNKGIASYIVQKLKDYSISNGLIPICGCWYGNYASKRTLEKSGFITKDRILYFEF